MKKILLGGLVILSLVMVGCNTGVITPTIPAPTEVPYIPVQPSGKFAYPVDGFGFSPPEFIWGSYGKELFPGALVDTFTDTSIDPFLPYNPGDQIVTRVYNGYDFPIAISVSRFYEDLVPGTMREGYKVAPEEVWSYLNIKYGEWEIPGKQAIDIPISYIVPEDSKISGKYEFHLLWKMETRTGMFVVGYSQRYLVTFK